MKTGGPEEGIELWSIYRENDGKSGDVQDKDVRRMLCV